MVQTQRPTKRNRPDPNIDTCAIYTEQPVLRVQVDTLGRSIRPATYIPGHTTRILNPLNLNPTVITPKEGTNETPRVMIGSKSITLKEVKGAFLEVKYEFYADEYTPFEWDQPLPDVDLHLVITVGRAVIRIDLPTLYRSSWYKDGFTNKEVEAKFRRASDVRGSNDTVVLSSWSAQDVCFYLRTHTLNYIVDDYRMGDYLMVWQAIVSKYEIMSNERQLKLAGGVYKTSPMEQEKLVESIRSVEREHGV